MPLGHHCSSPNSSSCALPRCCVDLCRSSKSQSKNRVEIWLWQVFMRAGMKEKSLRAWCHTMVLLCQSHSWSRTSPQGLSWTCGHIPHVPSGFPAAGKGYKEQLQLSRGQASAGLGCFRQGRRAEPGLWAEPRARVNPQGYSHEPSTPCSPPPYTPRQSLPGFFLLLFLLLTVLPPSCDEGMGVRPTAHFLAWQVMLTCIWLGLHSRGF